MNRRFFFSIASYGCLAVSGLPSNSQAMALSQAEKELFGLVRNPDIRGDGFNLRAKAATAFEAMSKQALQDGIKMYSYSSYRGFEPQSRIWNRKFQLFSVRIKSPLDVIREIILYSTVPGTSRHHWGTDLDIIDLAPKKPNSGVLSSGHFLEGGVYNKLYEWLLKNGHTYGFYEVYTNDPSRPGFKFEPWHWSFAEISIPLLELYIAQPLHEKLPIQNLNGKEHLSEEFFENYKQKWGLGINAHLLPEAIASQSEAEC